MPILNQQNPKLWIVCSQRTAPWPTCSTTTARWTGKPRMMTEAPRLPATSSRCSQDKKMNIKSEKDIERHIIHNICCYYEIFAILYNIGSSNCNDEIFAIFWNIRSLSCDYEIFAIFCNIGAKRQRRKWLEPSCGSWCGRSEGKDWRTEHWG